MKNVLKYPGSKKRVAPWIIQNMPRHKVYLEPYFGGGAVFFQKQRSRIETINDLSEDVYNYFFVLRECPEELIRKIHLTTFSRSEYERCYEYTEDSVERARRFAVRCCQGFGCSNKYKNGWRNSKSGASPITTNFWKDFPETLYQASERLKEAQIECRPAVELIRLKHKGSVMISGYDNEMYNEILRGWNVSTCQTIAENSQPRTEKIWMNYYEDNIFNLF